MCFSNKKFRQISFSQGVFSKEYKSDSISHILVLLITSSSIKKVILRKLQISAALLLYVSMMNAQISGVAFRDYNGNGIKDGAGEPGVGEVVVKLYINNSLPNKDLLIGSDLTDSNGVYDFSSPTAGRGPNPGEKIRVEFEIPTSANCGFLSNQLDFSSQSGQVYGSSVQFITAPQSNINFALNYSGEFVLNLTPSIYVPCYVNGDPLAGGTAGSRDAFIGAGFTWEGRPISNGPPNVAPDPIHLASASQIGSTYGVAFSRQSQKIFTSSYLKRHVGMGPLGPGGIYQIDPSTGTVTNFLNLHDINIFTSDVVNPYIGNTVVGTVVPFSPVVGSNVQRGLLPSSTLPNVDAQAWEQVGKVSIGDLDISDDGRYLYLVNLYDRKVYEIDLVDPFNPQAPTLANVATRVKSWATPDPGTTAAQGEHRPFGLAYYRGELYVGTVLSAQNLTGDVVGTEADMAGYLHKTTPGTGTWQEVLNFPMSYRVEQDWYPWSNNAIAAYEIGTPMISDIAFYKNGEILIGIRDRWADQKGWFNYGVDGDFAGLGSLGEVGISAGDLIRYNPVIQPDGSCLYTLISGGAGEFYNDNYYHAESSAGGLAMLPGGGDVVSTFMDPITVYSFGLAWYNNDTGGRNKMYEVGYSGDVSTFGKANGLGDIELSGSTPSLEIGNYVWNDLDQDGIQDPNEPGFPNVTLELYNAAGNILLGSTTTGASGHYYFNSNNVVLNGASGLLPFTNYIIRINSGDFSGGAGTGDLNLTNLTSTNQSGSGQVDYSDSDASVVLGFAQINITTGANGQNNHTFDIGLFKICQINALTIQSLECIEGGAANLDIDNILKVGILATNNNEIVTTYNVSVNGTTVTPSTGTYGVGQFFELGKGSGGTGATYIIVITDVVNGASCARSVPVTSPMTCTPAIEECETPKCGSSNIQVNGN